MPAGDPPRPTGSSELLILNRLDRFLRQQERDANEGITLRSVHNKVTGLQQKFENSDRELRERIARVEQNDRRDAEERAAGNTGRFFIPPAGSTPAIPTPVQPIPISPPPPAVEINVNGGGKRHDSKSPASGIVVSWAKKAGGPLAIAVGAWAAGHFGTSQISPARAPAAVAPAPTAYEIPAPPSPTAFEVGAEKPKLDAGLPAGGLPAASPTVRAAH